MLDVLNELKSLISAGMSNRYDTLYVGEVTLPAKSYMPAVMIIPQQTVKEHVSTACDRYVYTVLIRVVVDLKSFFDEAGTGDTIKSQEALMKIMEEREANGVPKGDTLLGILGDVDNIRGTNYIVLNPLTVSYEVIGGGEFPYVKAECEVQLENRLSRPNN